MNDRLKLGWPVVASGLLDNALGRLIGDAMDRSIETLGLERTARDLETAAFLLRAAARDLRDTAKAARKAAAKDPRQIKIPGA